VALQLLSGGIAIYGAVFATLAFFHQQSLEQKRVTVAVGEAPAVGCRTEDPLAVEVTNTGHRPITIDSVAFVEKDGLTSEVQYRQVFPRPPGLPRLTRLTAFQNFGRLLSEGQSVIFTYRAEDLLAARATEAIVRDAEGGKHRLNIVSKLERLATEPTGRRACSL
jgi:hypothetical protein